MPGAPAEDAEASELVAWPTYNVCVMGNTGAKVEVEAKACERVGAIKARVEERWGVPRDDQRLTFRDELLGDSRPLSFYGIGRDASLFLTVDQPRASKSFRSFKEPSFLMAVESLPPLPEKGIGWATKTKRSMVFEAWFWPGFPIFVSLGFMVVVFIIYLTSSPDWTDWDDAQPVRCQAVQLALTSKEELPTGTLVRAVAHFVAAAEAEQLRGQPPRDLRADQLRVLCAWPVESFMRSTRDPNADWVLARLALAPGGELFGNRSCFVFAASGRDASGPRCITESHQFIAEHKGEFGGKYFEGLTDWLNLQVALLLGGGLLAGGVFICAAATDRFKMTLLRYLIFSAFVVGLLVPTLVGGTNLLIWRSTCALEFRSAADYAVDYDRALNYSWRAVWDPSDARNYQLI